jgi:hypothetical protein
MVSETHIQLPADLPLGWKAESSKTYGTVITAVDEKGREMGYVTVDETVRNFALGVARPRRLQHGAEPTGRGWKAQLYKAAIACLREAIN